MKNTFTDLLIRKQTLFTRNQIKALIMRMSQVYLLIMVSAMITMAAPKGNGQSIESTIIQLEIVHSPLKDALKEIEKQTKFLFKWDTDLEKTFPKVSLPEGKYTVKEALNQLLRNEALRYKQHKNHIMIIPLEENESDINKKTELEGDLHEQASASVVTGSVKDATTQEPLAGVNIIVKGTSRGTTTDVDGKFGIEATENDVLVFSFIGFQPFEIEVNGRSVIDVSMQGDVTALKEVEINAGYWKIADKEKTGNIAKITAEDIRKQPVSNPLQALIGRMPGVQIVQKTGLPGGNITVQIRGRNSLRFDGNSPLYIVDGVPFPSKSLASSITAGLVLSDASPLNSINPSDIESIEILKDADATAIYGSRGANGVILITTKKGAAGKSEFDVSFYSGVGEIPQRMEMLNTQQYVEMRKEGLKNDGLWPTPTNYYAPDLLSWDTTKYTDWQNVLLGGTARTTNAQVSFTGGNQNTQFLIAGGYLAESTVFPNDFRARKLSSSFNIHHASQDQKLKIVLSNSFVTDDNKLPQYDLALTALTLAPNAPATHDENGNLNWENGTWNNPFAQFRQKYKATTDNLITNLHVGYTILPGLTMKSNMGYNSILRKEIATFPIASYYSPSGLQTGSSRFSDVSVKSWIAEPQAEYQKSIGMGKMTLLIGGTFQESIREGKVFAASGFTSDALIESLASAPNVVASSIEFSQYRYVAIFGRLNYNWREKYLVNITARRDGSTRFGPNKQLANFGAVGAAWIFSNENFFKSNLQFLTLGKIRSSYGLTGSDQISDYGYLDTYSATSFPYAGRSGLIPTRLVNPNYAWETNKKLEVAIELGLFENRLLLETSYYRNRSSNQLVGYALPEFTGFSSIQYNLDATIQNSGFEIEANSSNIKSNDFEWITSVNLTVPRDKLISYPNIEASSYANTYTVGKSLSTPKVYHYTGIDPQTGTYTFQDFNGNGTSGEYPADLQPSRLPVRQSLYGGIQNTITFRGWQLDIFFQYVKQTGRDYTYTWAPPGFPLNQPTIVMDRWGNPGDENNIQKFTASFSPALLSYYNAASSDRPIGDASFLRLKNVSLSYQLPSKIAQSIHLKKGRIYVQGQNLMTFSKYIGFDPETQSFVVPPLRMITAGVQVTL